MTVQESPHLTDATIQELQLELIRRTRFNNLDGTRVAQDLLAHRDLWEAALLDRPEPLSLIKLRDLAGNHWNADTLLILAVDGPSAARLAEFAEAWAADAAQVHSAEETQRELGGAYSEQHRLVSMWWD